MTWLAMVVIAALGAAVLTLTCSDLQRQGWAGRIGFGFAAGLVVLSLTLFALSWAGVRPAWWIGVGETVVLWAIAAALRGRDLRAWLPAGGRAGAAATQRATPAYALLCAVTCWIFASASAHALAEPLVEWDSVVIWGLKGGVLLHDGATAPYFADLSRAFSHLDYPLLWPLTMAWTWSWTGQADPVSIKVLAPCLLLAITASFLSLARRWLEPSWALLLAALLLALPAFQVQTGRLLADPLVGWLFLLSAASIFAWFERGHPDDARLGGLFAAGLLFVKNEGIGLYGALLCAAALGLAGQGGRGWRTLGGWIVALPLTATAPWFAFRAAIPKVHEDYGGRIDLALAWANASRLGEIARELPRYLLDFDNWALTWPLVAAVLLLGARRWSRGPERLLLLTVLFPAGLYVFVVLVSPWEPTELLATAAHRLLMQLAPVSLLLAGLVAAPRRPTDGEGQKFR